MYLFQPHWFHLFAVLPQYYLGQQRCMQLNCIFRKFWQRRVSVRNLEVKSRTQMLHIRNMKIINLFYKFNI